MEHLIEERQSIGELMIKRREKGTDEVERRDADKYYMQRIAAADFSIEALEMAGLALSREDIEPKSRRSAGDVADNRASAASAAVTKRDRRRSTHTSAQPASG
jgi:hypothetical protein